MSWLTEDEFLENLVKTDIDKIIKMLKGDWKKVKEYKNNSKLFVKKLNEINSGKYSWDYEIDKLYNNYKLDSLPSWGEKIFYPRILGGTSDQYGDLIMDLEIGSITFHGKDVRKWGIEVIDPVSKHGLHRCEDLYIYELVGLQGTVVTLQQIRQCVNHLHNYGEVFYIK